MRDREFDRRRRAATTSAAVASSSAPKMPISSPDPVTAPAETCAVRVGVQHRQPGEHVVGDVVAAGELPAGVRDQPDVLVAARAGATQPKRPG